MAILAAIVVAFVAQRIIASPDERQIRRVVEEASLSTDPSYCDALLTPGYLEQATGAQEPFSDEICEYETSDPGPDSVEVDHIEVAGDRATAVAGFEGGSIDGSSLRLALRRVRGEWKLDRRLEFVEFDRPRFERAYRLEFHLSGTDRRAADCALERVGRLSDRELERALLEPPGRSLFLRIATSCDRRGMEQSVAESAASPLIGLDRAARRCTAGRARSLSDSRLVRLYLDPPAYIQFLLGCDSEALLEYHRQELQSTTGLSPTEADCVIDRVRRLPVPAEIRLLYDEDRYGRIIGRCEG
jgi:hypothetical protein